MLEISTDIDFGAQDALQGNPQFFDGRFLKQVTEHPGFERAKPYSSLDACPDDDPDAGKFPPDVPLLPDRSSPAWKYPFHHIRVLLLDEFQQFTAITRLNDHDHVRKVCTKALRPARTSVVISQNQADRLAETIHRAQSGWPGRHHFSASAAGFGNRTADSRGRLVVLI